MISHQGFKGNQEIMLKLGETLGIFRGNTELLTLNKEAFIVGSISL